MEKAAAEQNDEIAEYFFTQAVQLLRQQGGNKLLSFAALEYLEHWIEENSKFGTWLEPFICCRIGGWEQKQAKRRQERGIEQQKHKTELITFYHQHIDAIRDGSAFPWLAQNLKLA